MYKGTTIRAPIMKPITKINKLNSPRSSSLNVAPIFKTKAKAKRKIKDHMLERNPASMNSTSLLDILNKASYKNAFYNTSFHQTYNQKTGLSERQIKL